jgi:hypothetical protein
VTHEGPQVTPVETHRRKRAMPAQGIQRIKGIDDYAQRATSFHDDPPLGLGLLSPKRFVDLWDLENRAIKNRVFADNPFVRKSIAVVGTLDQKGREWRRDLQSPESSTGQDEVVSLGEREAAIIAEELGGTFVDKKQLIAIAVARQVIHTAPGAPVTELQMRVAQENRSLQRRVRVSFDAIRIECAGAQRPLAATPPGGRMTVNHLRGGTKEPFFAKLSFKCIRWQIGMRLARSGPFDPREGDPFPGHRNTPRAI